MPKYRLSHTTRWRTRTQKMAGRVSDWLSKLESNDDNALESSNAATSKSSTPVPNEPRSDSESAIARPTQLEAFGNEQKDFWEGALQVLDALAGASSWLISLAKLRQGPPIPNQYLTNPAVMKHLNSLKLPRTQFQTLDETLKLGYRVVPLVTDPSDNRLYWEHRRTNPLLISKDIHAWMYLATLKDDPTSLGTYHSHYVKADEILRVPYQVNSGAEYPKPFHLSQGYEVRVDLEFVGFINNKNWGKESCSSRDLIGMVAVVRK